MIPELLSNKDSLELSNTVFFQKVDNFIGRELTLTTTRFINDGVVESRGHETLLKYTTSPIELSIAYNAIRMDSVTKNQPYNLAPADEITYKLKYDNRKSYISLYHKSVNDQNRVDNTDSLDPSELPTEGYNLWGFSIGHQHSFASGTQLLFNLKVDNIFNEKYRLHGDPIYAKKQNISVNISSYF